MSSSSCHIFDAANRLSQDGCAILARDIENQSIMDYTMFPINGGQTCEQTDARINQFAALCPNLRFRNGYGVSPCTIDIDSITKYGGGAVRTPEKNQLFTRVFQAVPSLNKGSCAPNTETFIFSGEESSRGRTCGSLAERNFDRFIPFSDCVQGYIDGFSSSVGAMNIIGENSRDTVLRGCKGVRPSPDRLNVDPMNTENKHS